MSLSALLLRAKAKAPVDAALDAIFGSSAGPSLKRERQPDATPRERTDKKSRLLPEHSPNPPKHSGDRKKSDRKNAPNVEEDEDAADAPPVSDKASTAPDIPSEDDGEASADSSSLPQHESLSKLKEKEKKSKHSAVKKIKFVPEEETAGQRDARTIFVGNLPAQIAKSRPLLRKLKQHIMSRVPTVKIESIRFRSVPFQNPTSKLEPEQVEQKGKSKATAEKPSTKQQRQQRRAADWREHGGPPEIDRDDEKTDEKTYLSQKEKRRLAFIKGELHSQAASVNAYVVFAHPIPHELRSPNVPHDDGMNPYSAAKAAVVKCDGTVFEERTIRVDFVGASLASAGATLATRPGRVDGEGDDEVPQAALLVDPKLSVFVGNLDFASTEEALRAFFEGLLCAERGDPESAGEDDEGSGEARKRRKMWVTRARIVRDRDTQLGKGFAYVQFADRECVDEVLAMEQDKLKFVKRKLRVQRCKTVPSSRSTGPGTDKKNATGTPSSPHPTKPSTPASKGAFVPPPPVPKGDPTLGAKLAGLSKDERKTAKAENADRIARRLAKKKARAALEKAGVAAPAGDRDAKLKMRTRKVQSRKAGANIGRKEGKGRVRSDRAMDKRNVKKQ